MLSGAVDARERFLVQQRLEAVSERHAAKCCHHEHVVIYREVGLLERRSHLELTGRDFVVPGSDRHSELVQLELCFGNAALDALRNSAEVMVLELLPAWRRSTNESTATHHEVRAHREMCAIDEEIFLLGPERREDALDSLVTEQLQQRDGLL